MVAKRYSIKSISHDGLYFYGATPADRDAKVIDFVVRQMSSGWFRYQLRVDGKYKPGQHAYVSHKAAKEAAQRAVKRLSIETIRKYEHWDDERKLGNSIIVTLKRGWRFAEDALANEHVRGFDDVRVARASVRGAVKCSCPECKPLSIDAKFDALRAALA